MAPDSSPAFRTCGHALLSIALALVGWFEPAKGQSRFPLPEEWPCYRRTPGLESRSPLTGNIASATIAWEIPLGGLETAFLIEPATVDESLALPQVPSQPAPTVRYESRWGFDPPTGEVGGRILSIENTGVAAWGDVFPDRQGLEKIEFDSSFAVQGPAGNWSPGRGRCLGWTGDRWETLWETPPMEYLFQPLPIIGDFDADGAPEVAILPWKELHILDAKTGELESKCPFTEGRSYGFFGVYDLDSDGTSEFVIQGDFAKHIDVLGYREGKLSLLWQRNIELDISNPQIILRAHPTPVGRLTKQEPHCVLENVFNGEGDGRWRLLAHNGLNGDVLADLPDEYLGGVMDLDGDGLDEILTTRTTGAGIPDYGPIEVWSLKEGEPIVLWKSESLGWQPWEPPTPLWVNTAATYGRRRALVRKLGNRTLAVFRKRSKSGETELQSAVWTGKDFKPLSSAQGPSLAGLSVDASGPLLAASSPPPGGEATVHSRGGRLRLLETRPSPIAPATVVAVKSPLGDGLSLAVQSGEFLLLYKASVEGGPPRLVGSIAGRGQSTQWPQAKGPVFGDLQGDGDRQILFATAAPTGCSRMVARGLDGNDLWVHDFPEIPGGLPVWNSGGIVLWQTGYFTSPDEQDVLVTVRRSMMHSEETLLLSGQNGAEIWRRNRQISNRGVGGGSFAIADFDGDGLQDCASMNPSLLYLLKGSDGSDLLAMDAIWEAIEAKPVYFASPIVVGIGFEMPCLFFQTSQRIISALVSSDGALVWRDGPGTSPDRTEPAIGDFSGKGRLEILSVGFDDGAHCYDAATGELQWTLPFGEKQTVTGGLSADIDSDGIDEAVFSVGPTLVCLAGVSGQNEGVVQWKLDFPCDIGPPSFVDLEGAGKGILLVVGSNGRLYGVR